MNKNDFDERVVPDSVPYDVWQDHINRYLFTADFINQKIVLDVACGSGYGNFSMSKKADLAVGVDISKESIYYAKRKYGYQQNLDFIVADASNLPFLNTFDAIVSFETIEHLIKIEDFLENLNAVLKLGGTFIVSTPNAAAFTTELGKPLNPYHTQEFTLKEFSHLLSLYFTHIEFYGQRYFSSKVLIFRFLNKYLPQSLKKFYVNNHSLLKRNSFEVTKQSSIKQTLILK
jgi:ubiquinone/menaquinone biosynthesis C-methylase UbiE